MEGHDIGDGTCTDATDAPKLKITTLPFELLVSILWSDELDQHDVGAVRSTCKALAPAAASRLFFRIYVSKLHADRDQFLAICNSPHLAQHVREVEWLEISYSVGDFLLDGRNAFDDTADLCQQFEITSQRILWLFNLSENAIDGIKFPIDDAVIDESRKKRADAIALFRPVFESAVDNLPNLHTFISRPMTSERVLSNVVYTHPMAAWQFQSFRIAAQPNDGLFLFLLPAMARASSTVTRLRWLDECSGCSYLRVFPERAFHKLESLEISAPQWKEEDFDDSNVLDGLKTALTSAAPTLRHFKLDLDSTCVDGPSQHTHLGAILLGLLSNGQFALRSLELSSMSLSTSTQLQIIRANATSLRHLTLEDVPAHSKLIEGMAHTPGLRLQSIQLLLDREWFHGTSWFKDLLDPDDEPSSSDDGLLGKEDRSKPHRLILTERTLLRHLSGERAVQRNGVRLCDLLSSGRPTIVVTRDEGINEIGGETEASSDDSETSSEDSVAYRQLTAPRWLWRRLDDASGGGRVVAFQLPEMTPDDIGHPTERWRFTSRNGEVGYGDDPLTWFEDWDLEAGDREEPLPYCKALHDFVRGHVQEDSETFDEDTGRILPTTALFEYDADEDRASSDIWY
ncbi:hypothetical protein B0T16DRAFT_419763 [Cercophora newfieldiana]|uniref:F-box domain-containing protein n=1 Tax=Cercophora newfieldiana TaxID=92897 RepID=A0AA40CJP1_9PEZI|nr:hypothetical protein B0T16DRAFT_419763 [Cercophora newfieldiana]